LRRQNDGGIRAEASGSVWNAVGDLSAGRGAFQPRLHRCGVPRHGFAMTPGFKEWTLVCKALGEGTQSLIIRKGGIAEGRSGFRFQHDEFLLFPTLFHEQVAKLKLPADTALPAQCADGQHEVSLRVRVEWTQDVADLGIVQRLAPFHFWQDSEIEKRFRYEEEKGNPGVSIAFVRIEKLTPALVFPDSPKYGGCRSWIQLPDPAPETTFAPVLDEATHRAREREIRELLDAALSNPAK
jgi:hypothetical protein